MVKVISLGGSIVVPDEVDSGFLSDFISLMKEWIGKSDDNKIVLVIGGGNTARKYIHAREKVDIPYTNDDLDNIGIASTFLNASLVKSCMHNLCQDLIITNPNTVSKITNKVLVCAGWKPGFSTDYDAVILASKLGVDSIINLSNIKKLYNKDPKNHPDATQIDNITFSKYLSIIENKWSPGLSTPFDPIASVQAQELKIKVIIADGKNLQNTKDILNDKPFVGSVITPD